MKRFRMFARILLRSAIVRPGRSLTTVSAVIVAAAVASAMLTLYVDTQAKLNREFRTYGANILVTASSGFTLPSNALAEVDRIVGANGAAAPLAFAVARTANGAPIVVAGTDMERARKLNGWWAVTGWPDHSGTALVGVRALKSVSDDGRHLELKYGDHSIHLKIAGTLRTGSEEDSRVYLNLSDFTNWTGVQPSTIEVAASGPPAELNATMARISAALPQTTAQPIRQIVEAEGRVFEKTRSTLFWTVLIISLTCVLCVLATLTSSLLDRRRDFALMKALGASQLMTDGIFSIEAASLGAAGGMIGYGAGLVLAEIIARMSFHSGISPHWVLLPEVLAGCVVVTLVAALLPLTLLNRIQPAALLKGE